MEWSRTTQVVAHTCGMVAHLPNAGFARLCPNFALLSSCSWIFAPNVQWGWPKREFSFYRVILKKIDFRNPLSNVFNLLFFLTLFRVFFVLKWALFMRLTPFFLQVDRLMDCSEGTRVVAGTFTNFWKFLYFYKFLMALDLKTGFLNPRHKMSWSWWK